MFVASKARPAHKEVEEKKKRYVKGFKSFANDCILFRIENRIRINCSVSDDPGFELRPRKSCNLYPEYLPKRDPDSFLSHPLQLHYSAIQCMQLKIVVKLQNNQFKR
jgi:hypothetical protein